VGDARGDVLDDKNDVFALGLVFWQYLTGDRPRLPPDKPYAAQAVLAGTSLSLPKSLRDVPVAEVVEAMLAKDASVRPSMSEVHSSLKNARRSMPEGKPVRLAPRKPARSADKPGPKGRLSRGRPASAADPAADGAGRKGLFTPELFKRAAGPPVPGFIAAPAGGAEAAMPDATVFDEAPPRADAPPAGAEAGEKEGGKLRGTLLKPRAPTIAAAAPDGADPAADATDVKFRGSLMRKTAEAAEAPPARAEATGDAPEDSDALIAAPTVDSKPRRRLLKRKE
jgi:hypothetical protein